MKEIALFLLGILFFIGSSQSQDKPKYMLGGNLDYLYEKNDDNGTDGSAFNIAINPSVGYILNDNFILGIGFGIQYIKSDMSYNGINREYTSLTLSPFIRYQKGISDYFKFYVEPNIGGSLLISTESDYKGLNVGTDVGILYHVSERFSLELKLLEFDFDLYTIDKQDIKGSTTKLKYDFITPNIGVKYYF